MTMRGRYATPKIMNIQFLLSKIFLYLIAALTTPPYIATPPFEISNGGVVKRSRLAGLQYDIFSTIFILQPELLQLHLFLHKFRVSLNHRLL